jgi:hypothetical protein
VFHGNNKLERIKVHPSGVDGFFYNGNFLILQRDEVVAKRQIFLPDNHPDKNTAPHYSKLYQPDKTSTGFVTSFMGSAIKNLTKMSKAELYREEAY